MSQTAYNFSAGPAALPRSVLEQAREHLLALPGERFSVMEISHRSKAFVAIIEETEANLRSLMGIPDSHKVLFLQGGASLQFAMVPMNYLAGSGKSADYILTGSWGKKALAEARRAGDARAAWQPADEGPKRVPARDEPDLDAGAAYAHYTSNETIEGVEFGYVPETGEVPLICDASSNFLSAPMPVERYGLLYAGAQKNAGPAGVTLVIVREDLAQKTPVNQYAMLDYRVHAEKGSLYNTPPAFAIYIVMLVTRWLRDEIGGLEAMAAINEAKAKIVYDAIGAGEGFYRGVAAPESRSRMNVTMNLPDPDLEKKFVAEAENQGLFSLKGHRSVGGIRASIYNAMPTEGCQALAQFMDDFAASNG